MKKFLVEISARLCLLLPSCKTIYVPVGTETSTNVKDSTVLHIVDSVRYTERSRYKDYGDLLNVLEIDGKRSHMRSWVDTTKNVLNGELTEDPIEEHTKIVWRDREVLKDTTIYKEIPVEKEVEKVVKVVPKFWRVSGILGIVLTVILGLLGFFKLKKTGFFSKISNILKIFKKIRF